MHCQAGLRSRARNLLSRQLRQRRGYLVLQRQSIRVHSTLQRYCRRGRSSHLPMLRGTSLVPSRMGKSVKSTRESANPCSLFQPDGDVVKVRGQVRGGNMPPSFLSHPSFCSLLFCFIAPDKTCRSSRLMIGMSLFGARAVADLWVYANGNYCIVRYLRCRREKRAQAARGLVSARDLCPCADCRVGRLAS